MSISHRYLRVGVPQNLLHFVECPPPGNEQRCKPMAQIMEPQLGEASLVPDPGPYLVHVCIGFPCLVVDEEVLVGAFGIQLVKDVQRRVVERD